MHIEYDLAVRSAQVYLPAGPTPAVVCVRGGRVAAIEPHGSSVRAAEQVDLDGLALLPGLVDTHVHANEPGRTEWEGFRTATAAAAAGGITTLIDMPLNSIPPTVSEAALRTKIAAADGGCHIDLGFWGGAVPGNVDDLVELHRAGVFGFKCFTAPSGVDEFPALDWQELPTVLDAVARLDALLLVHAEDPSALAAAPSPVGARYAAFLASRPREVEDIAVRRVAAAAARAGARVHVVHVSSATAVSIVRAAQAAGTKLTAETCPHYLTLAAEDVPDGATEYKCCPPIRERANAEALWRGLADGTLSCVVSDHSPCPPELKDGDFGQAWGGIAALQLSLPVVWTQARRRGHSLADVVRWMAEEPATLVGLRGRKGMIAVGADADLVAFDPDSEFVVDSGRLRQRHPVTPYAGAELTGAVHQTWLRGAPVGDVDDQARGQLLRRSE